MTFIDNILNYVTDSKKRLSSRASIIVLFIAGVFLFDNIFGFSEYYNNARQLEQLKSISLLLKDTSIKSDVRTDLLKMQAQTLKRRSIIDKTVDFFKSLSFSSKKETITTGNAIVVATNDRSNLWFLLSSSCLYIIIGILLIPVMLITDKTTPILKLIAILIMMVVIFTFGAWFNYWLFDLILPDKIFGSWTWNYIFNFLLQIGLLLGGMVVSSKIKT